MNAMQKVSAVELAVPLVALLLFAVSYPWLGNAAYACFAVLGLLGFTPLLLRKGGDHVVTDERDQDIDLRARFLGVCTAWIFMLLYLIVITLWSGYQDEDIPTRYLNAILWFQFALLYAVKGAVALKLYGKTNHAA